MSAEPPNNTCAPFTNLLPVTVIVYEPTVKLPGLTLLSTGVGFHRVRSLEPLALASAMDTASTVIVFGFGTVAGAVYTPLEAIVPSAAFPPTTPFTDQLTLSFVVPVTVAVKGCVAPARTFAAVGTTLTEIPGGGGCAFLLDAVPHPVWTRMSAMSRSRDARRKLVSVCSGRIVGRTCSAMMRAA